MTTDVEDVIDAGKQDGEEVDGEKCHSMKKAAVEDEEEVAIRRTYRCSCSVRRYCRLWYWDVIPTRSSRLRQLVFSRDSSMTLNSGTKSNDMRKSYGILFSFSIRS